MYHKVNSTLTHNYINPLSLSRYDECLLTHNYMWASSMEPRGISLSLALASARIQWWALILEAHNYKIQFKLENQHNNADELSQSPLPEYPAQIPTSGGTILLFNMLQSLPVTVANINNGQTVTLYYLEWGTWSSKVGSSQLMQISNSVKEEKRVKCTWWLYT